jgi:hypothetical protein
MKRRKNSSALTGIAGVHHVVSELSRRGMIALPTIRNTAAYDIIVVSPGGQKHANIQVKASAKAAKFWLMPAPNHVRAGPFDHYVFLRWMGDGNGYQGFMLSGKEVRAEVAFNARRQKRRGRSPENMRAAFHIGGIKETGARKKLRPAKLKLWAGTWKNWTL